MGDRHQTLRAVLHREGDTWIAHCLDLDIVSTGATQWDAARVLADAVIAQLAYAREEDNYAYLFHPAPADVWRRLAGALQGTQSTMIVQLANQEPPTVLELQVAA
jgi:hypothetical protein